MPFLSIKGGDRLRLAVGGRHRQQPPALHDGQPERLALPGHHLRPVGQPGVEELLRRRRLSAARAPAPTRPRDLSRLLRARTSAGPSRRGVNSYAARQGSTRSAPTTACSAPRRSRRSTAARLGCGRQHLRAPAPGEAQLRRQLRRHGHRHQQLRQLRARVQHRGRRDLRRRGACTCTTGTDCSGYCVDHHRPIPTTAAAAASRLRHADRAAIDSGLSDAGSSTRGRATTSADSSGNGNTATLCRPPDLDARLLRLRRLSFDGTLQLRQRHAGHLVRRQQPAHRHRLGLRHGDHQRARLRRHVDPGAAAAGTCRSSASPARPLTAGSGWSTATRPLSATVCLNTWHYLAITYDPAESGTEKFYVDGALLGLGDAATYRPSGLVDTWTTDHPRARSRPPVTNSFLNGKVDDVRAYSRALSAAEIADPLQRPPDLHRRPPAAAAAGGESLCGGDCTDKTIDPGNCGACGTTCNTAGGETCIASAAAAPSAPTAAAPASTRRPTRTTAAGCGTACGTTTCAVLRQRHVRACGTSTRARARPPPTRRATATPRRSLQRPTWTAGESGNGLTLQRQHATTCTATAGDLVRRATTPCRPAPGSTRRRPRTARSSA